MTEEQISKIYLICYFWLFLLVQTLLVYFGTELESPRGIINTVFTYLAFLPYYGYMFKKQISPGLLWRAFVLLFFLWQIVGFFYLYGHPLKIRLILLLTMLPFYWAVAGYALITLQQNNQRRTAIIAVREKLKDRFKSFIVIAGALAVLLLILCLYVMVYNYWQTRTVML